MLRPVIRSTWLSTTPTTWSALIAAASTMFVVIASIIYSTNSFGAREWMGASHELVFEQGQIWRAWTTAWVHGDERHLLSNAFLFFILGTFLNAYFGALVFPLATFFFGGLTNLVALKSMPPSVFLIGASGIVYWMGGAWLILYFFLERRKSLFQRALRATGVALMLFMPAEAFSATTSYRTHFIGFIFGVFFGFIYYFKNRQRFLAAEVIELVED